MRYIHLDRLIRKYIPGTGLICAENVEEDVIKRLMDEYKMIGSYPVTMKYVKNRLNKLNEYKKQLWELKKNPGIEQRTPAWYEIRKTLLTASRFGDACGFGDLKKLYKAKCGYEVEEEPSAFAYKVMDFGTVMEDVAIAVYEFKNNTKVHEFGLIPYEKDRRYGASPDGITDDGVMVEIKCPSKKEITGSVPDGYYFQVQGQLSICELDECDFCQFAFDQYDDEEEFFDDYEDELDMYSEDYKDKGIVVTFIEPLMDENTGKQKQQTAYEINQARLVGRKILYGPVNTNRSELWKWYKKQVKRLKKLYSDMDDNEFNMRLKPIFWKLEKVNFTRVYRDEVFVNNMFSKLHQVSSKITEYKESRDVYVTEVYNSRSPKFGAGKKKAAIGIDNPNEGEEKFGDTGSHIDKSSISSPMEFDNILYRHSTDGTKAMPDAYAKKAFASGSTKGKGKGKGWGKGSQNKWSGGGGGTMDDFAFDDGPQFDGFAFN